MKLEFAGKRIIMRGLDIVDEIKVQADLEAIGAVTLPDLLPPAILADQLILWEEVEWESSGPERVIEFLDLNDVYRLVISEGRSPKMLLLECYGMRGKN